MHRLWVTLRPAFASNNAIGIVVRALYWQIVDWWSAREEGRSGGCVLRPRRSVYFALPFASS